MNTIKGMIEDLNNKNTHICGCTTAGELIIALERLQMLEEQQPCDDCISREDALKEACEFDEIGYNGKGIFIRLKELPSVTPQPKMGEWIVTGYDYKCTNCEAEINGEINYMSKSKIKYCPYCGIKLEGEWDNNG